MIAVTVVTPSYRHLEKDAVQMFKKHSGLPVKIIRAKDKDGFMAKLDLDKHFHGEKIVFFDVDYWLLRKLNFSSWDFRYWCAVHDSAVFNPHAFPNTDCGLFKMDKLRYFNSGFFTCDLSRKDHRAVFQKARRMAAAVCSKRMPKPVDITDQFYLNKAIQDLNVSINLLPVKFNYYHLASAWGQIPYIPRDVIGLHAAGEKRENKLRALQVQSEVFGRELLRVCPEAYQFETARIFDMR